jgi:hypothetical protein
MIHDAVNTLCVIKRAIHALVLLLAQSASVMHFRIAFLWKNCGVNSLIFFDYFNNLEQVLLTLCHCQSIQLLSSVPLLVQVLLIGLIIVANGRIPVNVMVL